jgi:hypothetical protein
MKKQIFILIVTVLAGTTVAWGQNISGTITCPPPTSLTCLTGDALHPVPGTPYTYSVTVTPATGNTFKWIVTQEQTFLTNGVLNLANAEAVGGTHVAAASPGLPGATNTIDITWKSFIHNPSLPVFVVIYVENTNGCVTQNLEVFQIEPKAAFTLDIANLDATGAIQPADFATCVSNIVSAVYDGANQKITMDYGVDYLYYIVTAANFTDKWTPTFALTGTSGGTESTTIDWCYGDQLNTWNPVGDISARAANGTVGAAGECIVVRVTIDHNKEAVAGAGLTVKLTVDGVSNTLGDIGGATCTSTIGDDIAQQIMKPRPAIVGTPLPLGKN